MLAQMLSRDLANVCKFRIDHLRAARLGNLAKKHIGFRLRKAVVVGEPIDHLLEGDPHSVLKRPGAADCRNMGRRLDPRPSHALGFIAQLRAQRHAGANLGRADPDAFPVALQRVTIADIELRPIMFDRKNDRIAGPDLLDVEISAMGSIVS